MIKQFEEFINEDYFSKLANRKDTGDVRRENELTEDFVRSFMREDCERYIKSITIRKENGKPIVDIDGAFFLRYDVEQIPFQFGTVTGTFSCAYCENLTSLKWSPEKVGYSFYCIHCDSLTSLKGCPKEVGGDFSCSCCNNLTSLKGCPKEVSGSFDCGDCGKKFTKLEVQSLCNVKGEILL